MYLAQYTYSRPDKTANAGKIAETVIRIINADSLQYAQTKLIEYHDSKGETIEGIPKFTEGI